MSDEKLQCAVCLDGFEEGAHPVCRNRHAWCRACVLASVETAARSITDASCMPPRCCGDLVLPADGIFDWHQHPEEAARRFRAMHEVRGVYVDRAVIRAARHARGRNIFQFCPRCKRLVMRSGGCNHMVCLCGHEFCIICAKHWPPSHEDSEGRQPLCHPFYGCEDQHVLQIPPEVQARLDEEENQPPAAFADETAKGILCNHESDMLYTLRLRRDLEEEERNRARCDVCGKTFRAFLLQCIACRTLLCLGCRDLLWYEQVDDVADAFKELDIGKEE
ncbi:hypothetical protein C8A01DRAFT_48684 [Parachaetomium inaequale]|uniref:RING-type domain-containing protein n=1 Tax=Parachaetomium inaequale TaxID=2588326 RepID=A0AAN6PB36_9PEZI|nr:hypothetical protein C8A01DRAFT_48684 [Parachaetomium inaequale]